MLMVINAGSFLCVFEKRKIDEEKGTEIAQTGQNSEVFFYPGFLSLRTWNSDFRPGMHDCHQSNASSTVFPYFSVAQQL